MLKAVHLIDTIAAQATPAGRGGVAIIRVSGPLTKNIIHCLFGIELTPREATHLPFCDEAGQVIDEGLALFFKGPHSFTGEDVLELQGHGSPVAMDMLLARLIQLGARLARPGEFSERAFLNNKIDLTQAEAIADLIDASSTHAAKLAVRSIQGAFSKAINEINEKIINLRAHVEAAIDFVDEDIDILSHDQNRALLRGIQDHIARLQVDAKQGSLLREGITLAIAGKPNVGKSSLLNCLADDDVAIVTDIPGTTRDVLRHDLLIEGLPVHLIDTAGLRESDDVIEQEGIRRARNAIHHADVILHVVEASGVRSSHDPCLDQLESWDDLTLIRVRNKIDLLNELPSMSEENGCTVVSLSAKNKMGIDLLKQAIRSHAGLKLKEEGLFLARRRHLDALSRAASYVAIAVSQSIEPKAYELLAEELRLAQLALNEITGEFTADDLLGKIFSTFCIGK